MGTSSLTLGFGLLFDELIDREGLIKLDQQFVTFLAEADAELAKRFLEARTHVATLPHKDQSEIIIAVAKILEEFVGELFGVSKELHALHARHERWNPVYSCKRLFVQRRALKKVSADEVKDLDGIRTEYEIETLISEPFSERSYASHVMNWLEDEASYQHQLELASKYAVWAVTTSEGQERNRKGVLFKVPKKIDLDHLFDVDVVVEDGVTKMSLPHHHLRRREGFALTDPGADLEHALDHANYCIYCHPQGKDSCSKGLRDKATGQFQTRMNVPLNGCPLEEHISEMNILKAEAVVVGALAAAMINNPMVAGTGHRICNDCMKGCIYQKQEPVNIPQVETRSLRDVISLPWGFEIYSLLSRWNPLNFVRPLPKPDTGYKVLVVGLGPAGYTLAHHLMNDGHMVVGIDGLKIEPLPSNISGIAQDGKHVPFEPVRNIEMLFESLDDRIAGGFGGVAEYGITVRWNKNYLKLIRLLLERRTHFRMFGGVRFGGTLTYDQAFALGFDHIALCAGAGKPRLVEIPNRLVRGVRTASDFLMALQLTGAAKEHSIANLQLRLPVVVIGGGLTGIDATTESLAYYPVQVEKFLTRFETLCAEQGEAAIRTSWSEEESEIAEEFITHAHALREERAKAREQKREPDLVTLLKSWGGSSLVYRRNLQDSPSYRLNHEEVELAMQEGITFIEHADPVEVVLDGYGHAKGLKIKSTRKEGAETITEEVILPARTIIMAAGTNPNTVLEREDPKHFSLDGKYFQAYDEDLQPVSPEWSAKPQIPHVLVSSHEDGRTVSCFGDLHPSFSGNVVKAMGGAKQGYPIISRLLAKRTQAIATKGNVFLQDMHDLLQPTVHEVKRLTPTIIEVIVHAPLAAKAFEPGQFYRLQNYESYAKRTEDGTVLAMEGVALTGAWVDKEKGLLSLIVLEMGGSADLCAFLEKGEPVVVMGPTGTPTHIEPNEKVMLVGGGLGNAVLFSIGKAFKAAGSEVLYVAGYKKLIDRYKVSEIEEAADTIVWCCDEGSFGTDRPQDKSFHGNIVQAMVAYGSGQLGEQPIPLFSVDRIIAIGSDRMMKAVAEARHAVLAPYLKPGHHAIGSINSPMQCMMKEICAQCLQKHRDPKTGEEYYVYSCFNQDQALDYVDFEHLNDRLKQNSTQEKLTKLWIDRSLKSLNLRCQEAA